MKKLILLDGHALIFRIYYAFLRRPMVNSKGEDTSILFGFTKTLLELILKERPTHLAVAFDAPAKTFRHNLYPQYKANRSETPQLVKESLEPLIEMVSALSIPVLMQEGYEADDLIGSCAKRAEREGYTIYMVTPDKDYGQLVSDNIFQYKNSKGGEIEILGKKEICAQYGIDQPSQVIDILTLWGDSSDNIPGVRGVGEVSSKRLIGKFKSIENLYQNISTLTPKLQEALKEAEDQIELSKRLVTIKSDIEIELSDQQLELSTQSFAEIEELFTKYEFPSLVKLLPELGEHFNLKEGEYEPAIQKEERVQLEEWSLLSDERLEELTLSASYLSFKITTSSLLFGSQGGAVEVPHTHSPSPTLRALIESEKIIKVGYNTKELITLMAQKGIEVGGYIADIELMHYLITPERAHKLDILALSLLGVKLAEESGQQGDLFSSIEESESDRALKELPLLYPLFQKLKEKMEQEELLSLYDEMEMPLISVLSSMEREGIKIDVPLLKSYSKELTKELNEIEQRARELVEEPELNLSSPKQLGILLYEKLNLVKSAKKTQKKNYSTNEETLTAIKDLHPIIPLILEYRALKKLLSTYIDPLPTLASQGSDKIHTTFNQALTSTGRLSSIKPNLQNIPIRTARGREIRRAFIPSHKGGVLISADYSQIELRLMAHMSGDPHFIEAFNQGRDIHSATASKILAIPEDQLTKEQRDRAKVANFGIIYGISVFGLAQSLSISREESKELIEGYFSSYPEVKKYISTVIERGKKEGFVSTLYGRKRFVGDLNSKNGVVRGMAERNAINATIQGSAADIIKMAMVNVAKAIEQKGLKSRMVLQVHDELIFDVLPQEREELIGLIKEEMEGVIKLKVPLTVECNWGNNWLEAH